METRKPQRREVAMTSPVILQSNKLGDYINNMNSTTHTIACGLFLATLYVVICLVAALTGNEIGEHTMDTIGLFIGAMLGVGAGQFTMKRFSNTEYAAAKSGGNPPVIVPSNTTTVVQQQPPAAGAPTE